MTDYKVNLPKTNFPMKADLAKREPHILQYWQSIDLYHKLATSKKAEKFILHDGPPYANGEIHLGHAANKILKDLILKVQILSDKSAPYTPGWDCHGLPIELNVEKKFGRAGAKISQEEFVKKCREYAMKQVDLQREAFKRLGVLGDWEKPYLTMDYSYEANVIRALGIIIDNGYVGRGFRPVHWCTACGSALAEAEVEYQDKESPAIDVRFKFVNSEKFFKEKFGLENITNASIPIWTTTPWTLPANEAVCLHADFSYLLVHFVDAQEYLFIAKDLLPNFLKHYPSPNHKIVFEGLGQNFEHLKLSHPFLKKEVPVILGEHVTAETGTGAVHTAPAHGADDYKIGTKYNLKIQTLLDAHGCFLADTEFTKEYPQFINKKVFVANDDIIELLRAKNKLIFLEKITHSYPHCWRHKTPLIFRATLQWFISMDKKGKHGQSLRELAMAAIEQINWLAPGGKDRIIDMVAKRPDWCISRQRRWNTPIALFVNKKSGELHPTWANLLELVAKSVEKHGIEFWQDLNGEVFLNEHAPEIPAADYEKVNDTLDVWFDSGVSHFCVMKDQVNYPNLNFPADLYIEGADQYRGWFQSSLLTSLAMYGKAPYEAVSSHGFTVDGEGRKMSKSVGNVIAPQDLMKTLGADILRLWAASTYMYDDLAVSDVILQRNVDVYRTLRNTARFLLGNLDGFDPGVDLLPAKELAELDRYAIRMMLDIAKETISHYAAHEFNLLYQTLQRFIANFLSSFYFSVIKDRLYTMPEKSRGRKSAQTALYHILQILVRLWAPIVSFTAEEIWQEMRRIFPKENLAASIFLNTWYHLKREDFNGEISDQDWNLIVGVVSQVNDELEKLRAQKKIGSSLEAEITLYCEGAKLAILQKIKNDELRFILITSCAEVKPIMDKDALAVVSLSGDFWMSVKPTTHQKCGRCWHRRAEVGSNAEHQDLCERCIENLFDQGEERSFA